MLLYIAEVEKKREKIDEFRRKLGFIEFDIMVLSEYSIKSKIGKMIANEKVLEEFYVRIYEIDPYFHKNYKEKIIKFVKNGHEYMPFRINVYFSEYDFSVEVNEKKKILTEILFLKTRSTRKNSIVSLLELILIKRIMMNFMKLVEYFLESLKTKN